MNLQHLLANIEADLVSAAADGRAALHAEAFKKLAALQMTPTDIEATLLAIDDECGKTAAIGAPSDGTLRTVALGTLLAAPAMAAVKFLHGKHQKEEGWSNLTAAAPDVVGKDPVRARAAYELLHSTSPSLSTNTPVAADLMRQMLAAPQLDVGTVGRLAQTGRDLRDGGGDSLATTMSDSLKNVPGVMLGVQSLQRGVPVKAAHVTKNGMPTFFDWGSDACKCAGLTDMFVGSGQPLDQANNAFQMNQQDLGNVHLPLDSIVQELLAKETELSQREEIVAQQEAQMAQWQAAMQQMGGMYQDQTGVDPSTGQPAMGGDPAAGGDPSMGGEDPAAGGDPSTGGEDPAAGGDPSMGGDPAAGGDPAMGGEDPAAGGDPSMGGQDPAMGGEDPAAGAPPSSDDISDEGSQQVPPPGDAGAQMPPEGTVGADAAAVPGGAPEAAGTDASVADLTQPQGGEVAESSENPAGPVGIDSSPADVAAGDAVPAGTVDPSAPPADAPAEGEEAAAGGAEDGATDPNLDAAAAGAPPVDDGAVPGQDGEVSAPPAGEEPTGAAGEAAPAEGGMAPPPVGGDVVPPPGAGVVSPAGMPPAGMPPATGTQQGAPVPQPDGSTVIPITVTLPLSVSVKVGEKTDFDQAVADHDKALAKFAAATRTFFL